VTTETDALLVASVDETVLERLESTSDMWWRLQQRVEDRLCLRECMDSIADSLRRCELSVVGVHYSITSATAAETIVCRS
jgi:hypothetical protein